MNGFWTLNYNSWNWIGFLRNETLTTISWNINKQQNNSISLKLHLLAGSYWSLIMREFFIFQFCKSCKKTAESVVHIINLKTLAFTTKPCLKRLKWIFKCKINNQKKSCLCTKTKSVGVWFRFLFKSFSKRR